MNQAPQIACPDCGAPMVLRETARYRYPNSGKPRKFYGCSNWPHCKATHGAHPDGRPLGIPANEETKKARIAAHAAFDGLAKKNNWGRNESYRWLQSRMGMSKEECHIGRFTVTDCEKAIRVCKEHK